MMALPFMRPRARRDLLRPKNYTAPLGMLLLCTLSINILSLALPVMTLQVYDRILPNPDSGTLPILIAGVCVAVILEVALRLCRAYVMGWAGARYEYFMACKAMGKILNADLARPGLRGVGESLNRITAVGKLRDFYNGYTAVTLMELLFVPVFLAMIAVISGALALVPLIVLAVFMLVSLRQGEKLRTSLKAREKSDDSRFNFLIETLEGIHTVKALAQEKNFERRYEHLEQRSTRRNYDVTEKTASMYNMSTIFSHIMVVAVISIGAFFVLGGEMTNGALIATLLLSGRMMQPIQKALSLWARYQDYTLARKSVSRLIKMAQVRRPESIKPENAFAEGRLQIKSLSFRFDRRGPHMMKGLELDIAPGEIILINGAYGSGRSTLLHLISGIYQPEEGEILLDGVPVSQYSDMDLARHVGYVRAKGTIFRGSIRDNITCFGRVSEAQAREVSSLLNVDRDVARLPGGYDTPLSGHETDSIPNGLKQRIAIARVLAARPKLILFDNSDRSLDREGYAAVYSLLARLKGKASMILISDDNNIRGLADRVYEIQDGQLVLTDDVYSRGNVRPYQELRL